jgi:tungstate transport system substrate-binding protein
LLALRSRRALLLAALVPLSLAALFAACGDGDAPAADPSITRGGASPAVATRIGGSMILATTTSTQDSGLLDVLVPMFKEQTGIEVKVIAVGTGAALEMAARGDADAVLVHAPASEQKYVDGGDLVDGQLVMHNDFILVGPPSDPAKAAEAKDINEAMARIAATGPFISRGDNSGTNTAELNLWKAAGIDVSTIKNREETGQGMGATLNVADQKAGYTLSDRGTYLSLKKNLQLAIVFQGAKSLLNIYHAYVVNPAKHDGVKVAQARAFVAFMVAPTTQQVIGDFKKDVYGEALFIADAGKTVEQLGK